MLNLMKYELIKQKMSKIILAGFLILFELAFIIGVLTQNDELAVGAAAFLILFAMITFFVVALEAIATYYHDLRDKNGYMLFMTPHSVYTIMGSKILTGIITIIIVSIIFILVSFANTVLTAAYYDEVEVVFHAIQDVMHQLYMVDISWGSVILGAVYIVLDWIGMITSAFLSITLCMTLISGMRGKGFISFVVFCLINWGYQIASSQIGNMLDLQGIMARMGMSVVLTAIFAGICFIFSGYLLNKELSL